MNTTVIKDVHLQGNCKLIISKELQNQIIYLHKEIGNTEWSGILFSKVLKGNIEDYKNMIIKAENVYPMNIGSSTYTEYDFGSELIDALDENPKRESMKISQIHSH